MFYILHTHISYIGILCYKKDKLAEALELLKDVVSIRTTLQSPDNTKRLIDTLQVSFIYIMVNTYTSILYDMYVHIYMCYQSIFITCYILDYIHE